MKKLRIEYNPYRLETKFFVNNTEIRKGRLFNKGKFRLQSILMPSENWEGLIPEIERECRSEEVKISFAGRKVDFDDLKHEVESSKSSTKFSIEHTENKEDEIIDASLDKIMLDVKNSNIKEFYEKDENGQSIFDEYNHYKNGQFTVNVIATMSSGKSTLINALLHKELLPSKNTACTATVARIIDVDDKADFRATCYDDSGNKIIHKCEKLTPEIMEKFNEDENVTFIDIEGDIPAISSKKIKLVLRDTPGPNTAIYEKHTELTKAIIHDPHGIVLYVINATQEKITDDKGLLKEIADEMKKKGKESSDRFIFVINKCDELDETKETVAEHIIGVRDYLYKIAGIENPIIIPTSALTALVVRKKLKGDVLSRKEDKIYNSIQDYCDYEELQFEKNATLSPMVNQKINNMLDGAKLNDENGIEQEVLIHTGIVVLEEMIREYIDKYAYPMKIADATDGILSIIKQLNMEETFFSEIKNNRAKRELIKKQIQDAREKHQQSQGIKDEYLEKINKFELDDDATSKAKKKAEKKLNDIKNKYLGKGVMDKYEAKKLAESFKGDLELYQKNSKEEITDDIEKNVTKQGEKMIKEYAEAIQTLLDGINIDSFDFTQIRSFDTIQIKNVDDIVDAHQKVRTKRVQTGTERNPERKGIKVLCFWKPWKVPVYENRFDGYNVTLDDVINNLLADFVADYYDNIDIVFESAKDVVNDYKNVFKGNLDRLTKKIDNILSDLEKDVSEEERLSNRIKEIESKSAKVKSIEKELSIILD